MPTTNDYSMTVWLRLKSPTGAEGVEGALAEILGQNHLVSKIERIEDEEDEAGVGNVLTYSFQAQISFEESECCDDEPNEAAIAVYEDEWTALLSSRFQVVSLEVLDDALTSFLIAEHGDDD